MTTTHTYIRVTRSAPCTVCGKSDWCVRSTDGDIAICMRVNSDRPAKAGGWMHRIGNRAARTGGRYLPGRTSLADSASDKLSTAELELIDRQCRADLTQGRLDSLAMKLKLSTAALRAYGIGWHTDIGCYTFPMFDAECKRVGIRTRSIDGEKKCLKGSRLGLAMPLELHAHFVDREWLLIAEGETDAAAAYDLGFFAASRPGCTTCESTIVQFVARSQFPKVAILADADEPGQRGAHKLAKLLASKGRRVRVLTVPDGAKDLRVWKSLPDSSHHDLAALLDAPADRRVA